MKIAILGYGKEGQAVETYFKSTSPEITVFDNFTKEELAGFDLASFDLVFRTPSVPLYAVPGVKKNSDGTYEVPANLTSITKYFFAHCPYPIIGVTGTKGKGTTCAMTAAILEEYFKTASPDRRVFFVGNVGTPAIDILDDLKPTDIVVYELSSFQLWDLDKSPEVAVLLRIEPDHLDRHADFSDYLMAKSNLVRHQKPTDTCIYFAQNENSAKLAELSPGHKIPYPDHRYDDFVSHLTIPGEHNKENAAAAIQAFFTSIRSYDEDRVSEARNDGPERTTRENACIVAALSSFKPLPHHIEFIRTWNGIDFYDDSFSASYPALDVALAAFKDRPVVLIAGGKDRGLDLTETKRRIFTADNLKKVILIGETATKLAAGEDPTKYEFADTLEEAVEKATRAGGITPSLQEHCRFGRSEMYIPDGDQGSPSGMTSKADKLLRKEGAMTDPANTVVLLSPGAASFDMFKNFYDRGEKFQAIVKGLN